MPNDLRLVSTSRESPEFIAPVCDCFWHPRRLPGSPVPNELRTDSTSRTLPSSLHELPFMLYSHAFTVKPAIAQSVERLAVNQEVGGSSPLRGNIFVLLELLIRITKKKTKTIPCIKRVIGKRCLSWTLIWLTLKKIKAITLITRYREALNKLKKTKQKKNYNKRNAL